MTTLDYRVLINVAEDKWRRRSWDNEGPTLQDGDEYQPGDPMCQTWSGVIEWSADGQVIRGDLMEGAAWAVLSRHNRGDRPDGQVGPSFGSGDVVVLDTPEGTVAYAAVRGTAMVRVPVPENIDPRPWRQIMDAQR